MTEYVRLKITVRPQETLHKSFIFCVFVFSIFFVLICLIYSFSFSPNLFCSEKNVNFFCSYLNLLIFKILYVLKLALKKTCDAIWVQIKTYISQTKQFFAVLQIWSLPNQIIHCCHCWNYKCTSGFCISKIFIFKKIWFIQQWRSWEKFNTSVHLISPNMQEKHTFWVFTTLILNQSETLHKDEVCKLHVSHVLRSRNKFSAEKI